MTTIKEKEPDVEFQIKIKDIPEKIRTLGMSPEDIVRLVIDDAHIQSKSSKTKKSRWAEAVERISETPLSEEAAEHLRKASREFRENFRFREPPHFENIEDDE